MSLLHTKGADETGTPIGLKAPLLSIEDDVNPPTLGDYEVTIPEEDKDDHPKSAKPIPLQEMLATQRDEIEYQHYAATIGLLLRLLDFNKDGL